MSLELFDYILILVGGFIAGVINTFAGSGSIITLTLLIEVMGLDPLMANATNRVNVGMMNLSSSYGFIKNDKLNLRGTSMYMVSLVIGAIVGLILFMNVSSDQFREIFKYLLLIFVPIVLLKPSRFVDSSDALVDLPKPIILLLFFVAGLYGGFIQMGIGIFILILIFSISDSDLLESNAFKVASIGIYTFIAIIFFQYKGMIIWKAGLLIGISQSIGGFLAAKYGSQNPNANKWAYRILILVLVVVVLRVFNLINI